jgi:CrcB protein
LIATGFLGAFTTFSTFSLDAVSLWQRGETVVAALYVGGSVAMGILGLLGGLMVARMVAG